MAYYHILKQRRMELNLSIEYISSQTHLAIPYIRALENHDLDVFSDDFSFVRYFVHAYSDAIGVNWEVIKDEVDRDINEYARQRSMALSQAQRRMLNQMPSSQAAKTGRKTRRRPRSGFQKRISSISRRMQWKQKTVLRNLVIALCAILALTVGFSYWRNVQSANRAAQAEAQRQAELREIEQETQRLADQRQSARQEEEVTFEVTNAEENTYTMSNILENTGEFDISVSLPEASTVVVYKDDVAIDESAVDTVYEDTFEMTVEVDEPCTIAIEVGNYVGGSTSFTIAGHEITFNPYYWAEGYPAVIYINVTANEEDSEENAAADGSVTEQSVTGTEDQSLYTEGYTYESAQ